MIDGLTKGDMIITKAINKRGFICNSGDSLFFVSYSSISNLYTCCLDSTNTKRFVNIEDRDISLVYDVLTNSIKYQHDPSDNL